MATATDAQLGTVVEVYKNIHKSRAAGHPVYSIRSKATRRVIGHSDAVWLRDAKMVVKEAGRQRVLKEKRKNVHAWVEGVLCEEPTPRGVRVRITYNPYVSGEFRGPFGTARTAEFVELAQSVLAWNVKGDGESEYSE